MTDVGSVSVGVDVNGTGLGEKLAAQIRAAVLPVIAELNRELAATNKQLNNVSGGGFLKVIAGAREASKEVQKLNRDLAELGSHADNKATTGMLRLTASAREAADSVQKVGHASAEAAVITEASADAMAKAYDRVARAAERSADRQVAAAGRVAVANEAASRAGNSGGGGGGSGGNRGGGGRGGGLTGSGGIASFLTSPVGLNAVALGSTAVGPALLGITNLTGAVQQLGQAGLLLPGVFAAAGSSIGVMALGLSGLKDAYKSFDTTLGPVAMKKAKAAFDALTPTAKELLTTVHDLSPALTDLKATASNAIFDGISQPLRDTVNKDLPLFKAGAAQIGAAWNGTLKSILSAAGSDSTGGFLTRIFGNTAQAQSIANAAIAPIVHAFGTLAATGTDFLPKLAAGLDGLATRFDNFITKSAANGDLDRWIQEGIDAATRLGDTFLNIGKIVTDITKAAGGDGGLIKALDDGSTALHNFLSSADGQNKLKDFFASAREEWNQWKPILLDLGKTIPQVFAGLHDWGSTILPIFGAVTSFLTSVPGLISGAVTAFVAFRTLNAFSGLLGDLGKVSTALDGVGGKAGGLKGRLGGISALGPTALLGGVLAQPTDGTQNPNGLAALAAIGGGALLGFEVGGPWGAAAGALIGGVTQLAEVIANQVARIRKTEDQYNDGLNNRPPGSPAVVAPLPSIGNSLQAPGTAVAPNPAIIKPSVPGSAGLPGLLVPQALQGAQVGPFQTGVPVQVPQLQTNLPTDQLAQVSAAAKEALSTVGQLSDGINHLPHGEVNIQNNTPEVIDALRQLGYAVTQLPNGHLVIQVEYRDPLGLVGTAGIGHGVGLSAVGTGAGHSGGGVIPGWSPGVDNVWHPMSGGEGILIPEAVRGIGGSAGVYRLNSMFRPNLSRQGYRSGGVVPGGVNALVAGSDPVIGLLSQIRDLIAANGVQGSPLGTAAFGPDGVPHAGTGAAAGPGGATNAGSSILQAALGATGGVASDVTGSLIDAVASGTDFKIGTPTAASTSLSKLIQQGNPLAGAAAFGLNVPDYTRDGGTNGTVGQQGQKFDAKGRMYSDSGSLIDRTMTDLSAQIKASFDQLKSVINQVKDNTAKEVLEPLMKTAVTEGISAMSDAVNKKIGTAQGEAAAEPIAGAVSKVADGAYQAGVSAGAAQQSSGSGLSGAAGGVLGNLFGSGGAGLHSFDHSGGWSPVGDFAPGGNVIGNIYDEGGLWPSGTFGTNLSGAAERVLNPVQTQMFDAGMLGGWAQQPQQQHQAAAAGVDATSTVGADFFGVSQIPILGAIINLFIGVLLKLIGVQIDARNTLTDIGKDAREFRGAFQKFDATGRLINDTSAISDRSSTSDQEAADERIRILKIVIEGLIKFIIEKIIIPIGQAVANAAISAGGAAAGAAVNSSAPGAGGIVSALIDSGGQAGVGIVADLATSFTEAATPVLTDSLFGAFQSLLPGASTSLFGGGLLSAITGPLQGLLSPLTGGIAGLFATLLGGLTFDDGGVASGVGLMPKATIRPERVLSPSQTQSFDRLVTALERTGHGGNQITVHAPFTVAGGAQGAEQAHAKLLSLLGGV